MSENENRGAQDYSKYDSMPTEELEEILRLDAATPVGEESDVDEILYIMGVLGDRRRNNKEQFTGKTALEAFESFKQNYLNDIDEEEEDIPAPAAAKKPQRKPMGWLRGLTAAAAVFAFVIFGSVTANALGFDVWEVVATWAQETFHLGRGEQTEVDAPNPSSELEYGSLLELAEKHKIDLSVIPTWIPDGYTLDKIEIAENPLQEIYIAFYKNGDKRLKITVRSYLDGYPEQSEQDIGFAEKYESSGVSYFISSNYDQAKAVWINGPYECYIAGELTMDQLKLMIDSIGKVSTYERKKNTALL